MQCNAIFAERYIYIIYIYSIDSTHKCHACENWQEFPRERNDCQPWLCLHSARWLWQVQLGQRSFFGPSGRKGSTHPCYECKGCHGMCLLNIESFGKQWSRMAKPKSSALQFPCNFHWRKRLPSWSCAAFTNLGKTSAIVRLMSAPSRSPSSPSSFSVRLRFRCSWMGITHSDIKGPALLAISSWTTSILNHSHELSQEWPSQILQTMIEMGRAPQLSSLELSTTPHHRLGPPLTFPPRLPPPLPPPLPRFSGVRLLEQCSLRFRMPNDLQYVAACSYKNIWFFENGWEFELWFPAPPSGRPSRGLRVMWRHMRWRIVAVVVRRGRVTCMAGMPRKAPLTENLRWNSMEGDRPA